MKTKDLKNELYELIEIGDKNFLDVLHETAKTYMTQKRVDKMIAEGEEEIEQGKTYSLKEAKKMVDDWKKD